MPYPVLDAPISPLRQRLIDDMNMRRFSRETQRNYLRDIGRLATFLGRSPDTATTDDLRRFQIEQQDDEVPVPTMNIHRATSSSYSSSRRTEPDVKLGGGQLVLVRLLMVMSRPGNGQSDHGSAYLERGRTRSERHRSAGLDQRRARIGAGHGTPAQPRPPPELNTCQTI
ncbi:phage integrase N-terminal SAM-like domain-containing protein [Mesorhizobium sp. M0500]|uniref:phage integrase N-terminal SAM-like domain-containing protein n=1 Tax=Mesorhizobium sp. M0500 TaxID=2956953 RepID=UPI00333C90ED